MWLYLKRTLTLENTADEIISPLTFVSKYWWRWSLGAWGVDRQDWLGAADLETLVWHRKMDSTGLFT